MSDAPADRIVQDPPTDTARMAAESGFGQADPEVFWSSSIRYSSGIVVSGGVYSTIQPNRLRVAPSTTLTWTGALGKLGMTANGQLPTPLALPFHTQIANLSNHAFALNDRVILLAPNNSRPSNDTAYLLEGVLIECLNSSPSYPALSASWPRIIQGFTSQDVQDWLDETPWWFESRAGWTARYAHPLFNMPSNGEHGYGGAMAVVTSFGAMLLCSTLPDSDKLAVQTRMLQMADDLELFAVNYDANGGHGNGRYILWLIRQACYAGPPATIFASSNFSENQQIYRDGSGVVRWRFDTSGTINPTYEVCCTINRWMGAAVAAKLATFLGASGSDWVAYTLGYMTAHFADVPPWTFSMSSRLQTIFAQNRQAIGY